MGSIDVNQNLQELVFLFEITSKYKVLAGDGILDIDEESARIYGERVNRINAIIHDLSSKIAPQYFNQSRAATPP